MISCADLRGPERRRKGTTPPTPRTEWERWGSPAKEMVGSIIFAADAVVELNVDESHVLYCPVQPYTYTVLISTTTTPVDKISWLTSARKQSLGIVRLLAYPASLFPTCSESRLGCGIYVGGGGSDGRMGNGLAPHSTVIVPLMQVLLAGAHRLQRISADNPSCRGF